MTQQEQIERVVKAHALIFRHELASCACVNSVAAHFGWSQLGFFERAGAVACAPSFFVDWLQCNGHNVERLHDRVHAPSPAAAAMFAHMHRRPTKRLEPMPEGCKIAVLNYIDERCEILRVPVDLFPARGGFGRASFAKKFAAWTKLRPMVEILIPMAPK